ncbi:ExeM/NucH family extracellular endonuclease [Desertihabitans aurantiacus]|uniref:ExeM/NucH family extracellular endonuclease n=1 Tax=Desertihabitans aurantiacus TaxID=2282477 RepID=UPI000DF84B53|nr:ExeM/NucH family extracellular endonuclease [Desertihabitans aurantiacus]
MPSSSRRVLGALTGAALVGGLSLTGVVSPAAAAPATDLFFSEYVEGSSNNKALEIYNGTGAAVDLSGYAVQVAFNGSATPSLTLALEGTLAVGEVHVVAASGAVPAVLAEADQTTGSGLWNGDDAVLLVHDDAVVDSLGQLGVDPGSQWGSGDVSTADNTLRRLPSVCAGDTTPGDAFDPATSWAGFTTDTFDGLGAHTSDCAGDPGPDPDPDPEPEPEPTVCGEPATAVGEVQGSGDVSPVAGEEVTVEGTVVGDFQTGGFNGFYLQDAGDGDAATSDGVFVYGGGAPAVESGDTVRVQGAVSEYFGMTQITVAEAEVCATGGALPEPVALELPLEPGEAEAHEGMYTTWPQDLAIAEFFNYGRYGEIVLSNGRQHQPTAVFEPGSPEAEALAAENLANRITLDDGRSSQNPDPAIHPNGEEFTLDNRFRGGDLVTDATGVLDYRFDLWRVQPTEGATHTAANPRPDVPEVGGTTTVASFNVLNYFTTLGSRGADTPEELDRQEAKIVAALAAMDADVFGLIEIENNGGEAVDSLVAALNEEVGAGTYDAVDTGVIGTDEITTALIYKPAEVTPTGSFATLTSEDDVRFLDEYNRPTLAQTFTDNSTGGAVTVAVNHLKSKGSDCEAAGDPEDPDGQGNCNQVRTNAARALADWLDADPTGTGVEEALIIGDLNSYDHEDPITALEEAGWTDLLLRDQGELAYSYVFDGQLGYLDYALANEALAEKVTEAADWRINADEPSLLDYDMTFKAPAQDALFAPDPYRSSDHDPVLVGMELAAPDTTAPELELSASPESIWPPNNKGVLVEVDARATDDSGEDVTVELVSAEAEGRRASVKTYDDGRSFRVIAAQGAVYTFTYEATDAAGNTTRESVSVEVTRG